jgi:hypothetical protein
LTPPITPPTDNLYKFMSLAGVVMLVGSIAYAAQRVTDLQRQVGAFNTELKVLKADIELAEYTATRFPPVSTAPATTMATTRPAWASDREILLKNARMHGQKDEIETLGNPIGWLLVICIIVAAGGSLMGIFGFVCWHRRLQAPQDALLAEQLAEAKRKGQNAPAD